MTSLRKTMPSVHLVERNYPEAMRGVVALANIGHETTILNLVEDGVPVLSRTIKLKNFRSKWVGETERQQARILLTIRALGPVIVVVDGAAAVGILDGRVNAVFTAIVILSMALTPLLIVALRFLPDRDEAPSMDGIELADGLQASALVIGFGRFGQVASQHLLLRGDVLADARQRVAHRHVVRPEHVHVERHQGLLVADLIALGRGALLRGARLGHHHRPDDQGRERDNGGERATAGVHQREVPQTETATIGRADTDRYPSCPPAVPTNVTKRAPAVIGRARIAITRRRAPPNPCHEGPPYGHTASRPRMGRRTQRAPPQATWGVGVAVPPVVSMYPCQRAGPTGG